MSAAGLGHPTRKSASAFEVARLAAARWWQWLADHQGVTVALFILGIFLYCAWFGLGTRLGDDDIMNLNFAWVPPWHELAVSLLVPFTRFYRPAGSLLYRLVFDGFGLNFVPFRVAVYLLLATNIYLVNRLALRLSGSCEVGALAALLFTFHGRMDGIYRNNGTLYDVLCATFSLLTLLYYVSVRQRGESIRGRRWVAFLALFITALNAKEMAGALPILLLIYEGLWYRPSSIRQFLRNALPGLAAGILTGLAAYVKAAPGGSMYSDPAYRMTFSAQQFMSHWAKLMSAMFYVNDPGLSISEVGMIWLVMILLAAIARRRYLWFFLAFALVGPLPVIFIPWRGFFVMYLPYAGWVMFAATILVEGRNWAWSRIWKRPPLGNNAFEPERIFLFAIAAWAVIWMPRMRPPETVYQDPSHRYIRSAKNELIRLNQPLPRGARVLFLHDRFPADSWGPWQLAVLVYRDRTLRVDRPSMMKTAPDATQYDCVFDYAGQQLVVVRVAPNAGRSLEWPKS